MSCGGENSLSNVYSNRVLVGNWYESSKLQEYKHNHFVEEMKDGKLMLARFRKMSQNLNRHIEATQITSTPHYGDKVLLYAPHVPSTDPPTPGKTGLLLGGRIDASLLPYSADLADGCKLVGLTHIASAARNVFVISSPDYCDRTEETLKYAHEFMLALASSLDKKPLYVRYDPEPIPGLAREMFPLYLSENPVSAARWRVLPIQKPNITRFEQEGKNVPHFNTDPEYSRAERVEQPGKRKADDDEVNSDIVINHVATNVNLGFKMGYWSMGFHGKVSSPEMRTCLNVYKCEEPNNIWQLYVPHQEAH